MCYSHIMFHEHNMPNMWFRVCDCQLEMLLLDFILKVFRRFLLNYGRDSNMKFLQNFIKMLKKDPKGQMNLFFILNMTECLVIINCMCVWTSSGRISTWQCVLLQNRCVFMSFHTLHFYCSCFFLSYTFYCFNSFVLLIGQKKSLYRNKKHVKWLHWIDSF